MPTEFSETACDALSEIYAIRDIDLNTVRPIASAEVEEEEVVVQQHKRELTAQQMPLLGDDAHREVMPSFLLSEPIQVLGLSSNIEAYLHGQGVVTLCDLIEGSVNQPEARAKAEEYVAGRPLYESATIDFEAWLRSVIGPVSPLRAHVALEPYGLERLYPLSPGQKIEWRRLDDARKQENAAQAWQEWREAGLTSRFYADAERVAKVLVLPWMRHRQGLAAGYELNERLERLAENMTSTSKILTCFQDNVCSGHFPLERSLCHADHGLFADSLDTAHLYDHLIEVVMTYFYRDTLVYEFEQLVALVQRELTKKWQTIDTAFTTRALRLSPQFRVRKGQTHTLQIRLA